MDPTNEDPRASRGSKTRIAAPHGAKDPSTAHPGRRDQAHALLTALRASHRVLAEYRPLALGIRAAVYAAWPARKTINRALAMHCRSDGYLRALAGGGPRFDLGRRSVR